MRFSELSRIQGKIEKLFVIVEESVTRCMDLLQLAKKRWQEVKTNILVYKANCNLASLPETIEANLEKMDK